MVLFLESHLLTILTYIQPDYEQHISCIDISIGAATDPCGGHTYLTLASAEEQQQSLLQAKKMDIQGKFVMC